VAAFSAVFLLFIVGFDFGVVCIDDVYNPKVSIGFFERNLKDVPCENQASAAGTMNCDFAHETSL